MSDAATATIAPTRMQWLMLLLILIIATVLRFIFIGAMQPHFDELWHLELSTGRGSANMTLPLNVMIRNVPDLTSLSGALPWYKIPGSLASVTHPPLYSIGLRWWRDVFGQSIAQGRAFSAMLSMLCVLVLFDATRQLHGVTIALWAALIFALAPTQIQTAQQIRNYTALLFFALCAADVLLRIQRSGPTRGKFFLLIIAMLATLFTHYFAAPAVAAMIVYVLWRFRGRMRRSAASAIIIACVIFLVSWYPMLHRQKQAFINASHPGALFDSDPAPVEQTFKRLAVEPIRLLFEPTPEFSLIIALSAVIYFIPWLLLRFRPELLLWTLWLLFVVGFAFMLDMVRTTRHLQEIRHTILAAPALYVLIPALLAGQRSLLRNGVPALVALACLGPLGLSYSHFAENYRRFGSYFNDAKKTDEPIVFSSEPKIEWYSDVMLLAASHYSGAFPRTIVKLDQPATPQVLEQLHHWQGFWFVWETPAGALENVIPGARITSMRVEPYVASVAYVRWTAPTSQP